MPRNPSNTDLQGQINRLREDNASQHNELKAELQAISEKLDRFAEVTAAHGEQIKTHNSLQGQIMWVGGLGLTAILALAGWLMTHANAR